MHLMKKAKPASHVRVRIPSMYFVTQANNDWTTATRRSPRKTEKKPVYVLNLSIPPRHVDNCLEPAKAAVHLQNTEAAISFLSNVVEAFLVRHAFLVPRTARQRLSARQMSGDDPSPRKRRKVTREKELDWLEMLNRPGPSTLPDSRNVQNRAESPTSPLVVRPEAHSGDMETDAQFKTTWTDPATGEVFVVDTRTGNSYSVHARQDHNNLLPCRRTLVTSATRGSTQHSMPKAGSMPDWIKEALESNETYALPESRIPALSLSSKFAADTHKAFHPSLHQRDSRRDEYGARRTHRDSWLDVGAAPTRPGRFDKEALRRAQILGQVDRKFIACVVNCEDDHQRCGGRGKNGKGKGKDRGRGRALVLIDQHAADERIRVERFLSELCLGFLHEAPGDGIELDADADPEVGVLVKDLVPPVPVLLAPHEAERLSMEETQMAFRRWGINFVGLNELQLPDNDIPVGDAASGERGYTQVMVSSVPEVVGEKLLAGDELKNLIKGYLAKLETEGPFLIPNSQPLTQEAVGGVDADTGDARWQKAMRWCPRELHELVNSKACRGAIMFNDSLSVAQCTRLVRDLADTAFPFQCAHGRPSLVPLADLGAEQSREDYRTSVYTSRPVDWCQFGLSGG